MKPKLALDERIVARCREAAAAISDSVLEFTDNRTTVSIERATLRMLGVNGAAPDGTPLANRVIEAAVRQDLVDGGICLPFGRAMRRSGLDAHGTAALIAGGEAELPAHDDDDDAVRESVAALSRTAVEGIVEVARTRDAFIQRLGDGERPLLYVIVASGDIHEDTVQARVAALAGAQVIAVIRHTAQSLLDYVPEGANTGGFGGTYASQDNFRIMREALDDVSEEVGRYVRLCNYASGLCMPEMSVLGAVERLDMMLNDALYGVLFRDINMQRTLTDQAFSRLVSAVGGIIINTGEDNYLTTADPLEAAHTVLASQFINESLALRCGLEPGQIGLGHAMEMDPLKEDMLVLEIAQAQMAREIFPKSPIKYMPPTKHMTGNIFRGHVQDALFALASVMTGQGIHLLGMMTEAMHTPHIHDRYLALESTRMVMNAARHLSDEIEFRDDGIMRKRAAMVLDQALEMLESIGERGLFRALEDGMFADVSRSFEGGRGLDGVFIRSDDYWNPVEDLLKIAVKS
ncbi:MAG: D-lysine 5,6-aminomutase subunit alpha [Deltaproteobacteria bacterium]|nr:D-lysine 5,6-aminomutase subunit alpha [Deltaproteobacteria bacterium]